MCGIIAFNGTNVEAGPVIFEGLKHVEYRGYDSAGIATLDSSGRIHLRRAEGNLEKLSIALELSPIEGMIGIGHTRWATHGKRSEQNAHPHVAGRVALVHNGIITNHRELRKKLEAKGCVFSSETDTEVVPQLINHWLELGADPMQAIRNSIAELQGEFALAILIEGIPDIFAVRKGKSLIVGFGKNGSSIGSDQIAIASCADRYIKLENGDVAAVSQRGAAVYDSNEQHVQRTILPIGIEDFSVEKDGYRHFTLKEIHQQPRTIQATLESLVDHETHKIVLPRLPFDLATASHISIIACGTSYYAGLVARHWFESLAGIPIDCEVASEFLGRESPSVPGQAAIVISQSGETADLIVALEQLKSRGIPTLGIVNVPESTIASTADGVIYTHAYPEQAVASTKAFTAQLSVLACIAIAAARVRGRLSVEDERMLVQACSALPATVQAVLNLESEIIDIAKKIAYARDIFYLGRGTNFGIALEGALKLKEISYIHAEGYPGGELKHGPLALIEEGVPVIVIAPRDRWHTRTISNLDEVSTRGGRMILFSDAAGCLDLAGKTAHSLALPTIHQMFDPVVYSIAIQLLAYHVALIKGTDIDQPRNLAKSVTVE